MQNDLFGVLFSNSGKTKPVTEDAKDEVEGGGEVPEVTEDIPFVDLGKGRIGDPQHEECEGQERVLPRAESEQQLLDVQEDTHSDGGDGRVTGDGLRVLSPVLHPADNSSEVRDVGGGDEEKLRPDSETGDSDIGAMEEGGEGWFPRPSEDDTRLIESRLSNAPWNKRIDSTIEWKFPWAPGIDEEQKNTYVEQLDSIVPRMGAKSKLREWLVRRFPAHHTYVEPFGGSFKVLLWKRNNSKIEIINDVDDDLIHFFRHVSFFPDELVKMINTVPTSQRLLKSFRNQLANRELNGLERAAAFYVTARLSFNGTGTSYAGSVQSLAMCTANKKDFDAISRRLKRVDIRCTDCFKLIKTCNKKLDPEKYPGGVFFYFDPPYDQTHGYRTAAEVIDFGWEHQKQLHEKCMEIDANGNKFIQTNSATDRMYELYSDFTCIHRDVKYTVSGDAEARGETKELIIANFDITKETTASIGGLFG